ncbi:carbohydrate ABC transporter permease [Leifsonia poae]|uniref:carbohydrate ABC transporter permease n=1 Tax=Leifsonia poae TaxID=110933 RepID=UPI001CC021B5|nr:sugar ABC transporter permease [Leifsonia poae]
MTTQMSTDAAPAAVDSLTSPPRRGTRIRRAKAWPFALPAFIALALVLLYPLGYNVWISLHIDRLSPQDGEFVWFDNYIKVFESGALVATLGRTLIFTLGSLVLQFIVGLVSALALEAFPRAAKVIRPLLLTPWVMPGVAVATIWLAILNPISGLANRLLGLVGVEPVQWLSTPTLAMLSLIVVNTWKSAPYWMLMLSAGLKTVPKEVVEAARVDGASYLRVVWHVLLPGIRPVLATTSLLAFIWTFNYFDLAYLLTNGGPGDATTTLPFAIWESALKFNRFDQAAAYSVLSIALTGIAIAFYLRATRKQARS